MNSRKLNIIKLIAMMILFNAISLNGATLMVKNENSSKKSTSKVTAKETVKNSNKG